MSEPDFIAQTAELKTPDEQRRWSHFRIKEMHQLGVTFARCSIKTDKTLLPNGDRIDNEIILVEGWLEQPADQGEPRF